MPRTDPGKEEQIPEPASVRIGPRGRGAREETIAGFFGSRIHADILIGGNAMESKALNLQRWIDEHRNLLKPPVGNKKVFEDDEFIVMVVGGPNNRKDFHLDEGPEFFYQLEGEMVLKTIQGGKVVDIPIRAGEVFLLPPHIPHSPQRMPNSVGLVVERKRPRRKGRAPVVLRQLQSLLYEEYFALQNVETDFPPIFDRFFADEKKRTCKRCGTVMPAPAR